MSPEDQRGDDTISASNLNGGPARQWGELFQEAFQRRGRLQPGEVVARRFVVVRFLGAGGMGEVYEAEDRYLQGTHTALKALLPDSAGPQALTRFEREVLLARQIIHPNVCPVYDIVFSQDTPAYPCFIAMKLLGGETLAARLHRQGPLASEEAVSILRQIAGALIAAHRAKVLHRDLKPGNVMLQGSGAEVTAVVTDFGLAREYEPDVTLVSGGYVLGTPGYVAPEVLTGLGASPASDLYALGVTLHEMLCGHKPVTHPKTGHAMADPELAGREVPRFCVQLIEACLDPDITARYSGFDKALQILNPDSGRTRTFYPTSKSWSRRRLLLASVPTALAVGTAGWWNKDKIENLLQPLPKKRFVALMTWPPDTNKETRPILSGVMDAIETELARAEATDHDLFVISANDAADGSQPAKLTQIRDSLGANLVLGASGILGGNHFRLILNILDASSNAILRTRSISCALAEITTLPSRAVSAAATLLGISLDGIERPSLPTNSSTAYTLFHTAEDLLKEPNDTGLDAGILKYGEATSADPHFALAFAKLAFAYCHLYDVRRDSAAIQLARNNAERALELDGNSVDGHLALSNVFEYMGDRKKALQEISQALSLDPTNPQTLNFQAYVYARMNHWNDAEQTYRRINKQRPNFWPAYNDLGWVLGMQGKYQESVGLYRQATLAAPRSIYGYGNLGDTYRRLGNYADADVNFRKSLEIKPDGPTLTAFAQSLRAQRKYSEAVAAARKAVDLDPSGDPNWMELGDCYSLIRGGQKNAYEAYLRAATEVDRQLQLDSLDGGAWMRLAFYRIKCNPHDVVLPLVSKAESIGAADINSQLTKARILENLGRRQDALATLRASLRRGMTKFEVENVPDLQAVLDLLTP